MGEVLIAAFIGLAGLLGAIDGAMLTDGDVLRSVGTAVLYALVATVLAGLVSVLIALLGGGLPTRAEAAGVGLEPVHAETDAAAWTVVAAVAYLAGLLAFGLAGLIPAFGLALVGRRGSLPGSWSRRLGGAVWLAALLTIVATMWAAISGGEPPFWQHFWIW